MYFEKFVSKLMDPMCYVRYTGTGTFQIIKNSEIDRMFKNFRVRIPTFNDPEKLEILLIFGIMTSIL